MIGTTKPTHHIRINAAMRLDLLMWLEFLRGFNGVVYFPDKEWTTQDTLQLFTDSAGGCSLGCGCYFQEQWAYLQWPQDWVDSEILKDITFLELVPIVLSMTVWAAKLQNKKIIFNVDNMALVYILNKQSSKSDRVMSFIRPLVLQSLHFNIQFKAQHIPGKTNKIADSISRKQWDLFRDLAPTADIDPQTIPASFQKLLLQVK